MGNYTDFVAELMGTITRLSALHAGQLVNRAWSRVRDFRLWSFAWITDAQIFVPQQITAGSVNVTFGSTTVTVSSAAAAAFNAVGLSPPPLAGTLGQGRQLRIGASGGIASPTGPNYNILSWDGVNTLTLEKPYGENTQPNSIYQVLKAFYAAPALPFTSQTPDTGLLRFTSIINRVSGYSFHGKNLNWTQEMLNAIDPQRGAQDQAYIQANYGRAPDGTPVFELYPNPVTFTTYNACYVTRWPALSPSQDLPGMPYDLQGAVLYLAKVLAGQWALANVATFQELGQTNWVAYIQAMSNEFKQALIGCLKNDDELMPYSVTTQGSGFSFPLGGAFLQSHDVSSLIPK